MAESWYSSGTDAGVARASPLCSGPNVRDLTEDTIAFSVADRVAQVVVVGLLMLAVYVSEVRDVFRGPNRDGFGNLVSTPHTLLFETGPPGLQNFCADRRDGEVQDTSVTSCRNLAHVAWQRIGVGK